MQPFFLDAVRKSYEKVMIDSLELTNAQSRTDQKLLFTKFYLGLLHRIENRLDLGRGEHPQRAHEESMLFHLYGTKDAFLQELNVVYECGIALRDLRDTKLSKVLARAGKDAPELTLITSLEADPSSWLGHLAEMRHHTTHRANLARTHHVGGQRSGQVFLRDHRTGNDHDQPVLQLLNSWTAEMCALVKNQRASYQRLFT